jgi:hypothetical protein
MSLLVRANWQVIVAVVLGMFVWLKRWAELARQERKPWWHAAPGAYLKLLLPCGGSTSSCRHLVLNRQISPRQKPQHSNHTSTIESFDKTGLSQVWTHSMHQGHPMTSTIQPGILLETDLFIILSSVYSTLARRQQRKNRDRKRGSAPPMHEDLVLQYCISGQVATNVLQALSYCAEGHIFIFKVLGI